MSPKLKAWIKGLAVAVVTAIVMALLQLLVNPTQVAEWTWAQWKAALIISCIFGLIAGLTYMKQSPLPLGDPDPPVTPIIPTTPAAIPSEQKQKEATASGQDPPK